mmetsp:Transcript_131811/g.409774  ORF Transcript_131811/g.409774 Transcript_131811/m.409774 type:complete len:455 (-) Transcript_131811:75-1439(-)
MGEAGDHGWRSRVRRSHQDYLVDVPLDPAVADDAEDIHDYRGAHGVPDERGLAAGGLVDRDDLLHLPLEPLDRLLREHFVAPLAPVVGEGVPLEVRLELVDQLRPDGDGDAPGRAQALDPVDALHGPHDIVVRRAGRALHRCAVPQVAVDELQAEGPQDLGRALHQLPHAAPAHGGGAGLLVHHFQGPGGEPGQADERGPIGSVLGVQVPAQALRLPFCIDVELHLAPRTRGQRHTTQPLPGILADDPVVAPVLIVRASELPVRKRSRICDTGVDDLVPAAVHDELERLPTVIAYSHHVGVAIPIPHHGQRRPLAPGAGDLVGHGRRLGWEVVHGGLLQDLPVHALRLARLRDAQNDPDPRAAGNDVPPEGVVPSPSDQPIEALVLAVGPPQSVNLLRVRVRNAGVDHGVPAAVLQDLERLPPLFANCHGVSERHAIPLHLVWAPVMPSACYGV